MKVGLSHVPNEARKRILAEQNLEQLARWLEKAAMSASLTDVLDGELTGARARGTSPAEKATGKRP
jgi:hypothetical protein